MRLGVYYLILIMLMLMLLLVLLLMLVLLSLLLMLLSAGGGHVATGGAGGNGPSQCARPGRQCAGAAAGVRLWLRRARHPAPQREVSGPACVLLHEVYSGHSLRFSDLSLSLLTPSLWPLWPLWPPLQVPILFYSVLLLNGGYIWVIGIRNGSCVYGKH